VVFFFAILEYSTMSDGNEMFPPRANTVHVIVADADDFCLKSNNIAEA
jgi:hypothetical protein